MNFEELRALLVVVDQGSFLKAAVTLGVSRTTLRRQVDALEARAGVPLLHRNRQGVALTEAGRLLARGGRVMEQEFTALLRSIRETGRQPAGEVRVLLPVGLPPTAVAMLYGMFRSSWPELRVRTRFSESPIETNPLDVDVMIWFGAAEPSRAWDVHTVLTLRQRLLASNAYLAGRGVPRSVEGLRGHELLAWLAPGESEARLVTAAGVTIPIEPALKSTNANIIHECAELGLGVAWVPDAGLPPAPGREPLVPLLEDQVGREMAVRMAVPRTLAQAPKVRVFVESLDAMRALLATAAASVAREAPASPRARSS